MNLSMPITEVEEESQVAIQLNKPWKVIVLNDPVNLMNYVVLVFRKVFGYDKNKATKHMMEVHELGKSVFGSESESRRKVTCINCKDGNYRLFWNQMIEFQL